MTTVAVASCGSNESSDKDGGPAALSVQLSFHEGLSWLPLPVAKKLGYFGDDLTIDVQTANGSGYVTQQILAGNIDVGWAGAADSIVAFSKDNSLRAFMCQPPGELFQIVTRADSDIRQISDLRGRKLGITEKGGGEEPIVNAALSDAGMNPTSVSDITILPIGAAGPQTLAAIQNGTVDAYASSYPDIISLEVDGLELRNITPEKYKGVPGDCLITTSSVLENPEKREQIVQFARGWTMGGTFALANYDAALNIGCEAYPADCENPEFARAYVTEFLTLSEGDGTHAFGYVPVEDWQITNELLAQSGIVPSGLDMALLTDDELVRSVRQEADAFDTAAVEQQAADYAG
ncbi:ABC transporter substrate-binding protein [Mycolicibacterium sp.]|uniref:ABC transporter substrate-binding protein n=1 Tax=Mycolicibacterium sp. TaxID=2320850 RepID=UPI003D152077